MEIFSVFGKVFFRTVCFLGAIAGLAITSLSAYAAESATPSIRVDSSQSAQPAYRAALLGLVAKSGDELDVKSLREFRALLKRYGWPTVVAVGRKGVDAAGALALRASGDFALQEAIENVVWGERIHVDVNASAAANWIDKIEYRHDHKQILGTLLALSHGKVVELADFDRGYATFLRDFNGLPLLDDYLGGVQRRVDLGQSLAQANHFPKFSKKLTAHSNPELIKELGMLVTKDQDVRVACAKTGTQSESNACKRIVAVDRDNLPKVKAIFKEYGFPTARMVGRQGVSSFFLLVQHASSDPAFQAAALKAAAPLLANGEMAHQDYALLYDRVHLAMGEKQLYGTQVTVKDGGIVRLPPIEDPADLDERRHKMAMGTEKDYFEELCKSNRLDKLHHEPSCQSQLTHQLNLQMAAPTSSSAVRP